ncbi:MAG: hypothetical protein OXU36_12345 [Candidatus Poribacteria bacterium]|nr:hypothetical protein [Candidatus Poribacteria bacterium]
MVNNHTIKDILKTIENALKTIFPDLPKGVQKLMHPLLDALKVILPHLPKKVQRLMPGFLAFLPLAIEIAKLLYKHRREIRDIIENLNERASAPAKQVSDSIAMTVSRLPKKIGRKLSRLLKYLPFALEIAKASYRKNHKKVQHLTNSLPKKTQRKIDRLLKRKTTIAIPPPKIDDSSS